MLTIFTKEPTQRLQFVCRQIFSRILGCEWRITTKKEEVKFPVIWYTEEVNSCGIQIVPDGLLAEKGLADSEDAFTDRLGSGYWYEVPTIFNTPENVLSGLMQECEMMGGKMEIIPFDLFSASFYLITRYEEYLCKKTDCHGRYPFEESIAYRNGFITRPVVDEWCYVLKGKLLQYDAELFSHTPNFRFQPTIDVDNVFAYKNYGVVKTTLCCLRDVMKGKFHDVKRRLKTVVGHTPDPFFNLEEIYRIHSEADLHPIFFLHCGSFGKYDKKSIWPSLSYRRVRRFLASQGVVGLHPSYHSSKRRFLFDLECRNMIWHKNNDATEERPVRFHYLRMQIPDTYELLLEKGITSDWSLCYSNLPGFRASTSHPFFFYDLKKEEETTLMLYPTTLMDKTLHSDLKLTCEKSLSLMKEYEDRIRAVNGVFITLFHNDHFAEGFGWDGWKSMYESFILREK